MELKKFIALVLAISMDDPVQILSVTTNPDIPSMSGRLRTSFYGGQSIYMKVTGLDQQASNNKVMIGPHECVIAEKGVGGLYLTCETQPLPSSNNMWYNKIEVHVLNKRVSTCLADACYMDFGQQPQVQMTYPRDVYPTLKMTWQAYINSEDKDDIKTMRIGDTICDRFADEKEEQDTYFYKWAGKVGCQVSADIPAGYYPIKLKNQEGWTYNSINVPSVDPYTNQVYDLKVLPLVTKISSQQISTEGIQLEIEGYGFGEQDQSSVSVSYLGKQAKILDVQSRKIVAEIPKSQVKGESVNNYIGGAGLEYVVYDEDRSNENLKSFSSFQSAMMNGQITEPPKNQGFLTNAENIEFFGKNTFYYYKGWFKAPRTANYKFYAVGYIASTSLWLGRVPGSTQASDQEHITEAEHGDFRNYEGYYFDHEENALNSISKTKYLQAGQYYYLQFFQHNPHWGIDSSKVTIAVEIENDSFQFNSRNDIQKIQIQHKGVKEILQFKIYNGAENSLLDGYYQLRFRRKAPGSMSYVLDVTSSKLSHKYYNTDQAVWNQFRYGGDWPCTVVRKPVNMYGQITDGGVVAGYEFTVTFDTYRGDDVGVLPELLVAETVGTVKTDVKYIQSPNQPITGGYFKLQLNGQFLKKNGSDQLDWQLKVHELQGAINSIYPTCEARAWSKGSPENGRTYYFQCRDIKQSLPEIKLIQNALTSGTSTSITISIDEPKSPNQFFEPIPSDMLFMSTDTPQVQVSVNNLVGLCDPKECSMMATTDVARITAYQLEGLIMTLYYSSAVEIDILDVLITFGNGKCEELILNSTQMRCTMEAVNGLPVIEAGEHLPRVHVAQFGYMTYAESVQAKQLLLSISSITPNIGSLTGGTEVTISGQGFPRCAESEYRLRVLNADLEVVSMNNREIKAIMPQDQGVSEVKLQFNSQTATVAFTYSLSKTVLVSSLSDKELSPFTKSKVQNIVVTGQNFGSVKEDVSVILRTRQQPYRIYELKVNSVSESQVEARVMGGKSGVYDLIVSRKGWGYSRPAVSTGDDNFNFIIRVFSVSPAQGTVGGGTLITIKGRNFDTGEHNTLVVVGDIPNWFCDIQHITDTEIQCLTPPMHDSMAPDNYYKINVITRLTDYASGNIAFAYTWHLTPTITSPLSRRILAQQDTKPSFLAQYDSNQLLQYTHRLLTATSYSTTPQPAFVKAYDPNSKYEITGSGFGPNPILHIGNLKFTSFLDKNDGYLSFRFPFMPSGEYLMRVEVPGVGFASKAWIGKSLLNAWHMERTSTPVEVSQGGQTVLITGKAFSVDENPTLVEAIDVSTNQVVAKLHCFDQFFDWANEMYCNIPKIANSLDKTFKIKLTGFHPETQTVQSPHWVNLRFIPRASLTPYVDAVQSVSFSGQGDWEFPFTVSGSFSVTLSGSQFGDAPTAYLETQNFRKVADGQISSSNSNQVVVNFPSCEAGYLRIVLKFGKAFASFNNEAQQNIMVLVPVPTTTPINTSILGGPIATFTGTGFSLEDTTVTICGFNCEVKEVSATAVSCRVPPFLTLDTQKNYHLAEHYSLITKSQYKIKTDTIRTDATSDDLQTTYYSSSNPQCYIIYDFGENQFKMHQFRYFPRVDIPDIMAFIGAHFQVSQDGVNYETIFTINSNVHSGWNFEVPETPRSGIKYFRFIHTNCEMAEIQVFGWVVYGQNPALGSKSCNALISVNGANPTSVQNSVTYSADKTAIVESVSPQFGSTIGGTRITITGQRFDESDTKVLIDGIECVTESVSSVRVVCVTGNRQLLKENRRSFEVLVQGGVAFASETFTYANRFSDEATWGGDIPPREMDSVVVPRGQTLIVDESIPRLNVLIVEGSLMFSDEKDMEVSAHYIIVKDGTFEAGTEQKPKQKKLTITLFGEIGDKQLPEFGNKMIACHCCTLDLHGERRSLTWTELAATAHRGQKSITLSQQVDWRVGEEIVIASTGWNHLESERRVIKSISNGSLISFDEPLRYKHYSAVETYGSKKFPMRAEVGLLSRNIVIQGDENSEKTQYGAHVMIHGKMVGGALGRIEYTEFRNVGQPRVLGRYPIHYHLNGEMFDSYVTGNSVHDSFARCITIHGVHYLRVSKNVGYNFYGHGLFMEDGIETNNVISENLILGGKQTWIMLQRDITVSTYWITNPYNTVVDNRSGGSEWYGFWYEIKPHPDGPSARSDICPQGLVLKKFQNNVAHSNGKYGLRILEMAARQYPCQDTINPDAENIYADNPAFWSTFTDFATFQNKEVGVLGEFLGSVKFQNIMVADSKLAGFQSHKTNLTAQGASIDNYLIVGKSIGNANPDAYYRGASAIITPRTNGFHASNVQFYNFDKDMFLLQSCSRCDQMKVWVTGGKTSTFDRLYLDPSSIQATKYFWQMHQREIFWDLDGSLTGQPHSYAVPFKHHLKGVCDPLPHQPDTMICKTGQVRDMTIVNPMPQKDFEGVNMNIKRVGQPQEALYTEEMMVKIKKSKDISHSFATPLLTGHTYEITFQNGINFQHLSIKGSPLFTYTDMGYVLKFPYTALRESFQIQRLVGGQDSNVSYTDIGMVPDPETCQNGQWWNDKDNSALYICISGKGKSKYEHIDVNPVICSGETCANGVKEPAKDNIPRKWSQASIWGGALPVAGQKVLVPGNWDLVLDQSTPILEELVIDGYLRFSDTASLINLQAKRIWVRAGKIIIGSYENRYQNEAVITLHGSQNDQALFINEFVDASNKVLAVTNAIQLYGKEPGTVWTRLSAFADQGSKTIQVKEASDWKVGDELVIAASGSHFDQSERVSIASISGTTITLSQALQFNHYGASEPTFEKMDMRAAVGHLSRNVRIEGGQYVEGQQNWGCRVLVTQFEDTVGVRRGYVQVHGAEFKNCGQFDTDNAGLNFYYLNYKESRVQSNVIGSSFHSSSGQLLNAVQSHDLNIYNNVFYKGVRALVTMIEGRNNKFVQNLLMEVRQRVVEESGIPNWAVLGDFVSWSNFATKDEVTISENVGVGSEDCGFFLMAVSCEREDENGIYGNQVSAAKSVGVAYRESSKKCSVVKGISAFHNKKAIHATMNAESIKVSDIVAAENKVSVVIKSGSHNDYDNAFFASNWFISAFARPDCPKCYELSLGNVCADQRAYQMATVSTASFPPPLSKPSEVIDIVCTVQKMDGRVYMHDITFHGFKAAYPFASCANNFIFHQSFFADDMTASHYLTSTKCQDCDKTRLFKFLDPNVEKRGWFGGCGQIDCTGQTNVLVQDQDGSLLGSANTVISNNQHFSSAVPQCTRVSQWNGYECAGLNYAILTWMDLTADFNQRLFSPVRFYSQGTLYNVLNAQREWSWDGSEPLNLRESKFYGLIQLYQTYDIVNEGKHPQDYDFWLHRRLPDGKDSDWVIIRLKYDTPEALQVLLGKDVVRPFPLKYDDAGKPLPEDLTKHITCGANNYIPDTNTIEFVLTGSARCRLRVRQVNNVVINAHISLDFDSFWANDKFGSMVNKVVAFLDIDPSQLRIVGVKKGSTIAQISVEETSASGAPNNDDYYDPHYSEQLQDQKIRAFQNGQQSLKTTLSDLADPTEPAVSVGYDSFNKYVQYDPHFSSTEVPPNESASELLRNQTTMKVTHYYIQHGTLPETSSHSILMAILMLLSMLMI